MTVITDVENAFADLLMLLGRVMVEGRIGEAGAPAEPYAIWSLESIEPSDFTYSTIIGDNQVIVSPGMPMEFLVNLVGGNAMQDALTFILSFRQSQRLADIYKICGLSGITRPQDIAKVETGKFRQRVEFRVTLFTSVNVSVPAELIESLSIHVSEPQRGSEETINVVQGECQ